MTLENAFSLSMIVVCHWNFKNSNQVYLLDTNHCTFLIEGEQSVVEHVRSLGKVKIATSAIVAGELRFMAQNSQHKTSNQIKIRAFLQRIDILSIDPDTAEIYGDFKTEIIREFGPKDKVRRKATRLIEIGIGENDLWIAATALQHSLIVVSTDSDFERMRQVREFPLESWL
jgi:tRNA(fMet)-specific endonuclease VapC